MGSCKCPLGLGCLALSVKSHPWRWRAQEMYDMVGLLLMIRINYQHRLLMNKRRIPCLDDYLDRVNLQLWPRFKVPANGLMCLPMA